VNALGLRFGIRVTAAIPAQLAHAGPVSFGPLSSLRRTGLVARTLLLAVGTAGERLLEARLVAARQ
jgi:hypothetical protein